MFKCEVVDLDSNAVVEKFDRLTKAMKALKDRGFVYDDAAGKRAFESSGGREVVWHYNHTDGRRYQLRLC